MSGGLTRRTILASGLLALLVGGAFAVLVRAIDGQHNSAALSAHSQQVLAAANLLERLVLDIETGQRGFLVSDDPQFLQPWRNGIRDYPRLSRELVDLARIPAQDARARGIAAAIDSYVRDYSIPLVAAAGRGERSASSSAALAEGKRRVDALRRRFGTLIAAEQRIFATRQDHAREDARLAVAVATAGLVGSIVLIVLFGGYVTRAIALPVRRIAGLAGRLAAGDLAARAPENGADEVGELQRAFNAMGSSLEANRDELRQLAEEQAALRRVATLVAHGMSPDELFGAVATEVALILGADVTGVLRADPAGDATIAAVHGGDGSNPPTGTRYPLGGDGVVAAVLRTGEPARTDEGEPAAGPVAALAGQGGVHSSVGAPIVVERRLWGVMVAAWTGDRAASADSEHRMAQFTELVATAIANAESRAELKDSRARVVAAGDETRRRIERDLHDGAQQHLVHTILTLKMAQQSLGASSDAVVALVDEALEFAERATAELRELAHGILPAALSRGGLRAGVDTLVSRARLPVSVDITSERLPRALEATAYFIVAEALTNTVKHAHANRAQVTARVEDGMLRLEVRDDGVGGAHTDGRSGLVGLRDRAAALNGELRVDSPPGGGTVIVAALPIPA